MRALEPCLSGPMVRCVASDAHNPDHRDEGERGEHLARIERHEYEADDQQEPER